MALMDQKQIIRAILSGGNDALINLLAEQAINDMISTSVEMWNDLTDEERAENTVPDATRVREMALDWANDMIGDLRVEVARRIQTIDFDVAFNVKTELVVTNKVFK